MNSSGLLRLSTAGSVDDGKSTLIGRLLYDSKGAYEDQMASITKSGKVDLALLTDGLRSEREQGITIDVAYRYFSTPKRKFIIADTPGHEQYTRNMATGASTADLAIILIDARNGVLPQSRRHAYIATLLGIRHLVVAVNKMDLMGFDEAVFQGIKRDFSAFARQIHAPEPYFLPIAALLGDNVVTGSSNMPWFSGPHLLEFLESVQVAEERERLPARFPVQYVIRPNLDYRGYAGQVASGVLRTGDAVLALPSGRTSRIKRIATYDGDMAEASAPMSVTVLIEDEIDIGRGDMLVPPHQAPQISRRIDATVVWMNQKGLELDRTYLLKHTTQTVRATVNAVHYRIDMGSLAHEQATTLHLNEIGSLAIETHRPLFFDRYQENRVTGALILIDPATNETLAAGMISGRADVEEIRHTELEFKAERVTAAERLARTGHPPAMVDAPDEDLAYEVERELFERGCFVAVIRGDQDANVLMDVGFIAVRVN
ncbi:MAG: sulfate adenylyltransferase subunit 1, partial [Bryobacterales bacterium]|nr:sulfate adenylyltransferase subunit 1 [Bryobacterales bacterium]